MVNSGESSGEMSAVTLRLHTIGRVLNTYYIARNYVAFSVIKWDIPPRETVSYVVAQNEAPSQLFYILLAQKSNTASFASVQ